MNFKIICVYVFYDIKINMTAAVYVYKKNSFMHSKNNEFISIKSNYIRVFFTM